MTPSVPQKNWQQNRMPQDLCRRLRQRRHALLQVASSQSALPVTDDCSVHHLPAFVAQNFWFSVLSMFKKPSSQRKFSDNLGCKSRLISSRAERQHVAVWTVCFERQAACSCKKASPVLAHLWLEKSTWKRTNSAKLSSLFPQAHIEGQESNLPTVAISLSKGGNASFQLPPLKEHGTEDTRKKQVNSLAPPEAHKVPEPSRNCKARCCSLLCCHGL